MNPVFRVLLAICLVGAVSGCARIRLPAIDPTGERIFLPAPNSTTLQVPEVCGGLLPDPAWEAPPTPPPCPPPGVVAVPAPLPAAADIPPQWAPPFLGPGVTGLTVFPARVIAPVGTEVYLFAAAIGPEGPQGKQTVEWTLSQNSVGQIVYVDQRGAGWWDKFHPQRRVGKRHGGFAVTRTPGPFAGPASRGSPGPVSGPGQTWISVTSPSEGTTFVTGSSMGLAASNRSFQTAVVHWVDAQWELPPPAVVAGGAPHRLTTTLRRATDGQPIAGWTVRYEVVDPTGAVFAGNAPVIEVLTGTDGRAEALLETVDGGGGQVQVRVRIIRPASADGSTPRLDVGEGFTSVTWNAPGLALRATGPPQVSVGEQAVYRVEVINHGSVAASNVVVRDTLPPALARVSTEPPAQVIGNQAQWNLGELPPGTSRILEIQCTATADRTVRYTFSATADGGVSAEAFVDTQVIRSSMELGVSVPESVPVGELADVMIELRNTSGRLLEAVRLRASYDAGLQHTDQPTSPLEVEVGDLAPGDLVTRAVQLRVIEAGRRCVTIEALAGGVDAVGRTECFEGTAAAPRPGIRLRVTGPEQREVGEEAVLLFTATNTGNTPLPEAIISVQLSPELEPTVLSDGFDPAGLQEGVIRWDVGPLAPGVPQVRQINCTCAAEAAAARAVATVAAGEVSDNSELSIRIVQPAAPPPMDPPGRTPPGDPPEQPPGAASLDVSVNALVNAIRIGEDETFLIVLENGLEEDVQDVVVELEVPEGFGDYELGESPVPPRRFLSDGKTITLTPIRVMRPGDRVTLRLTGVARTAGEWPVVVRVTRRGVDEPSVHRGNVTVLAE